MDGQDEPNRVEERLQALSKPLSKAGLALIVFLIGFGALECVSSIPLMIYEQNRHRSEEWKLASEVFDTPWAEGYFEEFTASHAAEYAPWVGHRRVPSFAGKYITLDDRGLRKTTNPCKRLEPLQIYFFGGSTGWGTGARNEHTIPSYVSKQLCERGNLVEVTNFSESGYTNTQEMFRLLLELRAGRRPDFAIFYSGVNDVFSAWQNQAAGLPQNVDHRRVEFNTREEVNWGALLRTSQTVQFLELVLRKLVFDVPRWDPSSDPLRVAADTVLVYLANVEILRSLESHYGFEAFFFWQPVVHTKHTLSAEEQKRAIHPAHAFSSLVYQAIAAGAAARPDLGVVNISDVFDGHPETIFFDAMHISEAGNEMVARAIVEQLVTSKRLY